ncbi:unnamed protein product, partial [Iphiclides podalirius]
MVHLTIPLWNDSNPGDAPVAAGARFVYGKVGEIARDIGAITFTTRLTKCNAEIDRLERNGFVLSPSRRCDRSAFPPLDGVRDDTLNFNDVTV